jgi:lipid-A-disaccharide synthase-like uncharacterized protein
VRVFFGSLAGKLSAWWDAAWVSLPADGKIMLLVGILGQSLFVVRWLVQLVASEKAKQSVVPPLFWYLSFGGAFLVLVYAIYAANLVLIIGQFGIIIYARNLYFLLRDKAKAAAPEGAAPTPTPRA